MRGANMLCARSFKIILFLYLSTQRNTGLARVRVVLDSGLLVVCRVAVWRSVSAGRFPNLACEQALSPGCTHYRSVQMGEGTVITINSKEDWTAVHQKAGDKAVRMSTVVRLSVDVAHVDKYLTAGHRRLFCHLVWALPHDFSIL